jgi:hypothetical protein
MSTEEPQRRPYLDPQPGQQLPEKQVSATGYARLQVAADAIAATKRVIQHQGNQIPSLRATRLNSAFRLQVMRDESCWEYLTEESRRLAQENYEADVAAKAELAHGGNCGEHAAVAFHYVRLHAQGQPIYNAAKSGLDHAFVLIGDLAKDTDADIAVSDPWPNNPTACLWEDHFAHTADRTKIETSQAMIADGKSYKAAIAAGLKLSSKGEQLIQQAVTQEQTEQYIKDGAGHLWNHEQTVQRGSEYHYRPETGQPARSETEPARPHQHG